ncbi:MAG: hypothetical protein ACYTG5_20415 [Planctomycetota bacterium]|jgi:hypothetical protein
MHRTLCLLCLTLLTNALAAQEIDSRDHLDGTQWFIDAFRVMDGHPPEYAIQNALELELLFDRGGELRILRQGKVMATENLRIDSSGQSQSLTLDLDCGALGILHFDIEISEGELTGSLSAAKDEKGLPEYELTGRKATSLDGTRWKLTLTPEATEVDEAVDGPFSQLLRFHRGRIQLVHDEDSELSLDPVFYSGGGTRMATPGHRKGDSWQSHRSIGRGDSEQVPDPRHAAARAQPPTERKMSAESIARKRPA